MEYFGSRDHEEIWNELNKEEAHRERVIEWLEAMILTNMTGEIEEMNRRAHALKVQEASRRSKGIAMKRFIDKQQSPQCQIDMPIATEHCRRIWSRPEDDFVEATDDSMVHLESRITEEDDEEMTNFMINEVNIETVIKSRDDLSACRVDGISYRIMKGAGTEGVKFMKLLVLGCMKRGPVLSTWKEAKTILLHKKGSREEIGNWKPISITNCIYRIFTCLMARAIQEVDAKCTSFQTVKKGLSRKPTDRVNTV
jgi:hypothetical protein